MNAKHTLEERMEELNQMRNEPNITREDYETITMALDGVQKVYHDKFGDYYTYKKRDNGQSFFEFYNADADERRDRPG